MVDEILDDQVEVKEKFKTLLLCEDLNRWDEAILNFKERFDMGVTKARLPIGEKNGVIKATNRHIMVSRCCRGNFQFQRRVGYIWSFGHLARLPKSKV